MDPSENLRIVNETLESILARAEYSPGSVRACDISQVLDALDRVRRSVDFATSDKAQAKRYVAVLERLRAVGEVVKTALIMKRRRLEQEAEYMRNASACAHAYRTF